MKCNTAELRILFEEQGVFLENVELNEIIPFDSLTFVTLIIAIENYYNIEIPDEYMLIDKLNTFEKAKNVVDILLAAKE